MKRVGEYTLKRFYSINLRDLLYYYRVRTNGYALVLHVFVRAFTHTFTLSKRKGDQQYVCVCVNSSTTTH